MRDPRPSSRDAAGRGSPGPSAGGPSSDCESERLTDFSRETPTKLDIWSASWSIRPLKTAGQVLAIVAPVGAEGQALGSGLLASRKWGYSLRAMGTGGMGKPRVGGARVAESSL